MIRKMAMGRYFSLTTSGGAVKGYRYLPVMMMCLLLTACGYHLAGNGRLPGGADTIGIRVLANRTALSGLEATVTNALVDEFTRRQQNFVVAPDRAEVVLSGSVDSLSTATVARSSTLTAVERRMVITASLVLKNRSGAVLWSHQISANQTYTVASQQETNQNLRLAAAKVAQRLAEYAYERLTQDF
jgi:outer membrane lipopolysaccharide assembly protein LptE/RlpB